MDISLEKWLVMGVLTVLSILLGLLPYILVRHTKALLSTESTKYKVILTILSCMGGGVLFATSMLHLLPDVREGFEGSNVWETLDDHFPLAEVVVIVGFCLIYLVEEIAHFIMVDGDGHHHHMSTVARSSSIAHGLPVPDLAKGSPLTMSPRNSIGILPQNVTSIYITSQNNNMDAISENSDLPVIGYTNEQKMRDDSSSIALDVESPNNDDQANFASSLRTFLALVALSFHAIMEGVAIGLQNSSNVWVMFGAVASHKFVISFCMGMELVSAHAKPLAFIGSIVFFAIISPIGIILGSVLASDDSTKSLVVTIIEGIACGTLLYVVFFEILNRERERKNNSMSHSKAIGFIQFVALVVGLVGMGFLLTLTHDPHGAESGDDDSSEHGHPHSHPIPYKPFEEVDDF